MKTVSVLLLFFVLFCSELNSQTFEILNGDTINQLDHKKRKQGLWVLKGKDKPGTCYASDQKMEEGKYVDNRKVGLWMEYYCNGHIKNKLIFVNGRPSGPAIMFHESGAKSEEGIWYKNKWIGTYTLYYTNGKPQQQFNLDQNGKRFGINKYYYSSGKLSLVSTYEDGKPNGFALKLNQKGGVDTLTLFENGDLIWQKIKPKDHLSQEIVDLYDLGYESVLKKEVSSLNFKSSQKDTELILKEVAAKKLFIKASSLESKKAELEERSEQQIKTNTELTDYSNKQTETVSQQKKVIVLVTILSILFIFLGVIIFLKFKQAKEQKIKIENQNKLIETKQKEIIDSIHYAKRIQTALITSEKYIEKSIDRLTKEI